jgi:hypothetical protein
VALETTIDFHKKMKELYPDVPSLLSVREGPHGFDAEMTGEEEWIKEGCEFIRRFW